MKARVLVPLLAAALALPLSACSGSSGDSRDSASAVESSAQTATTSASPSAAESSGTAAAPTDFETADGVLTATDLEAGLAEGAGVRITIEPGAGGTATFQLVDPASGDDYSDYFIFNYADRTFVRHHNVAARGMTYNYTMGLDDQILTGIADDEGNDASEAVREHGRWDSAQTETAELMTATQEYFQNTFGVTIEEKVTG